MRIIFMGTPGFAVSSLEILVENGYKIVGVVTAPDKPAGRGQQMVKSAVKIAAERLNLKILQPKNLKSKEFISELKLLDANLQIVVAFRMLPEEVWNMPNLGTYNLHASLLPDYRGAAPINWAIINGEKETGVTTFKLKHEIDTGNILFSEKIVIENNWNAANLHDKLMFTGAQLLLKSVVAIERGEIKLQEQANNISNSEKKHAPKIFKENCKINWNQDANKIHDFVRGLSPYPSAWTELCDETGKVIQVKIFSTEIISSNSEGEVGKIILENNSSLRVNSKTKIISILELQIAGRKKMPIKDFLQGNKINSNNKFI